MSDTDAGPRPKLVLLPKPKRKAPAHACDPRAVPVAGTSVSVKREALFDLLDELKKLTPCHRDPHRFHARKDELVARLHNMAIAS